MHPRHRAIIIEALQAKRTKLVHLKHSMSIDHQECIQGDIDEIDLIIEGMENGVRKEVY